MNSRTQSLAVLCAFSLTLAACGGGSSIKDTLGYGKSAPDEFDVITKAPLVMPPDFSLRPPQPGVASPREKMFEPSLVAQRALNGEAENAEPSADGAADNASAGEEVLLAKTGGADANPQIRQVVNNEMRSLVATIVQAEKLGTSIAKALRTQAEALRTKRRQAAEERAQKTAVKLLLPLIMFIFPTIFIVLAGPAAIHLMNTFGSGGAVGK